MVLVFGGAYQGKLGYTLKRFELLKNDVFFCNEVNTDAPKRKRIVDEVVRLFCGMPTKIKQ